ncbi:MAG TPA: fused MFS/spermidine synthase, partial [Pirellulales bacterium]
KAILPWFGGTPAVWTTCLLFFQTALLLGYAYSHFLVDHTPPKTQVIVHVIVLAASLIWLPLAVSADWAPTGEESPTWQVLGLLAASLLGPYVALSATAPLLQSWFAYTQPGKSPYWLYALSNTGSLLALMAFPFVLERWLGTRDQMQLWSGGYLVFLVLCTVCAASVFFAAPPSPAATAPAPTPEGEKPTETKAEAKAKAKSKRAAEKRAAALEAERASVGWMHRELAAMRWMLEDGSPTPFAQVLWIILPFISAMLLSAGTNQLCQDVTVVPFLWILPLALYLVSFIIAFNFEFLYARRWWFVFLGTALVWTTFALFLGGAATFELVVGAYCSTIFIGCVICHSELVRLKPPTSQLTQFYLFMSLGGALGGAYVALVAPVIFDGYWEFHLSLFLCYMAPVICAYGDPKSSIYDGKPKMLWIALMCGLAAFSVLWISQIQTAGDVIIDQRRGFFGVKVVKSLDLEELPNNGGERLPQTTLQHGSTLHGSQFKDPELRDLPNSYYSIQSGVGLAIELHPKRFGTDPAKKRLVIGVVGLGAGTTAALAQPGDTVRFYEIDPQVVELAQEHFTYLKDSAAHSEGGSLEIVLGDARVSLAREIDDPKLPKFDVLVIDAFSSDAVPLHLLTKEAFTVYKARMAPDGILCMHVSNRYLDLTRVCRGAAEDMGWTALNLQTYPDVKHIREGANWVIVTQKDNLFLSREEVNDPLSPETRPAAWGNRTPVLWTDDRSNLFDVMAPPVLYLDRPVTKIEPVVEGSEESTGERIDGTTASAVGETTSASSGEATPAPKSP